MNAEQRSDAELMRAYGEGDGSAFNTLFDRHRRPLFTFLLHQTGRRDAAEDLFQEVFMRLIKSRGGYRPSGSFRAWLYAIARHALIDDRRQASVRPARERDDGLPQVPGLDSSNQPVSDSEAGELRERIAAALLLLPDDQREVFLLRERAGLDFKQIAEVTGEGLATVKSRMRYALAGLRRRLAVELAAQLGTQAGGQHD